MDDNPHSGSFPGLLRTLAIGFALAAMVGGLYLFSASYQTREGGLLVQRDDPNRITALRELTPPLSGS